MVGYRLGGGLGNCAGEQHGSRWRFSAVFIDGGGCIKRLDQLIGRRVSAMGWFGAIRDRSGAGDSTSVE